MNKIIIIGAGASGLMAAIAAARKGSAVTILEGTQKPGKKLLVTGNGRCNLTNTNFSRDKLYRGTDPGFVEEVFRQFSVSDTLEFFKGLGLLLKERDGYIYPYVEQASAVLDILLMECKRLNIKIKCTEKVDSLIFTGDVWKVKTAAWTYECDKVVLSAGSMAAPATGSDGSGYTLAGDCGHNIILPLPSLVPLKVKGDWYKSLSGLRSQVKLSLYIDGKIQFSDSGELQWTDYGISGIVVFQLSGFAVRARKEGKSVRIIGDLMPQYSTQKLFDLFCKRQEEMPEKSLEALMVGMFSKKMILVLLKSTGLKGADNELDEHKLKRLVTVIKECAFDITGPGQLQYAQVCQGGVDTSQINNETMESRLVPGLYMTGEIIDIDGACGGYNLQWAWSSGYVAGVHCAGKENTK